MKCNKCLIIVLLAVLNYISAFAQSEKALPASLPTPSGRAYQLLTPQDTLMVTMDEDGQKFVQHTIKNGQTLYGISKYYNVSLDLLKYHNPQVEKAALAKEQMLKIPIPARVIKRLRDSTFNARLNVPVCYQVRKGETVYRIARMHFKMTPALFRLHNPQIKNDILSVGDTVLIGWLSVYGLTDVPPKYKGEYAPIWEASDRLKDQYLVNSLKRKAYEENGIAAWKHKDRTPVKAKLYCLHRTAPLNSIVKITNPMNKQTIFAKVLGRIPNAGYDRATIVVLSTDAARGLGALDPKFYVKLTYLK